MKFLFILVLVTLLWSFLNCADQVEIIKIFGDVLKHSIKKAFCIYFLRNHRQVSHILEEVLFQLEIPVTVVFINGQQGNISLLSTCKEYVIAANDMDFLSNLLGQATIQPHAKVAIIFSGEGDIMLETLREISLIKGLDPILIEGLPQTMMCDELVPVDSLKITSVITNKILMNWNYSNGVTFNSEDFRKLKWSPLIFHNNSIKSSVFRVSAFNCPPFLFRKKHSDVYDGIEYRILKEFTKDLPLKFKVYTKETARSVNIWLTPLYDLQENAADLALCNYWQVYLAAWNLDLSMPYGQSCNSFLVPKPKKLDRSSYVFQPLHFNLWIVTICISVIIAIVLHLVALLYRRMELGNHPYLSFVLCLLDVIQLYSLGSFQYLTNRFHQNHLQLILTLASSQSLILITAYSSGFSSILTYPKYSKPIRNFDDVVDQSLHWESEELVYQDLLYNSTNPILNKVGNLFSNDDLKEFNNNIEKKQFGLAVRVLDYGYVANTEELNDYGKNNLRLLRECFLNSYSVFPMTKDSVFIKPLNHHISLLMEHGLIQQWHREISGILNTSYMSNFYSNYQARVTNPQPLSLNDIQGAFYLLFVGYTIAFVIYLTEIILHSYWKWNMGFKNFF